jgi:hypothetical protein
MAETSGQFGNLKEMGTSAVGIRYQRTGEDRDSGHQCVYVCA